jgi:hypothetical protein
VGPMLAAQYVLMCQTTGSAIPAARGEMPAAERVQEVCKPVSMAAYVTT